ncbi:hypothetical protein [uncultured Desulfosarcina sp.]|uniref:hypothetical protein n=1 Tax=uncultured Desulfosarcina sp. TaxID=218289 RepID=UPI0029C98D58|nr:hypothetical protein [uncultured Desulfosarcina sp.]
MKRFLLVFLLLLSACAHLPNVQPMDGERRSRIESDCQSHFLQGRWQLVHTITARLYGGRVTVLTGVIVLSSADRSIHCVLMTLEGFVLFEAADHGEVTVKRAFGPFDNSEFAQGVTRDIRLIFLAPEGKMQAAGKFADGTGGCRYQVARQHTVDLVERPDGGWRMHQYDPSGYLLRSVTADPPDLNGISHRLTLEAGGRHAYRLSMTLVEAVRLQ